MNLRCAIVDDEPLALGLLESYIKKTSFLELSGSYSSAIQAMKYLPEHPVDVLFLDIQMPELFTHGSERYPNHLYYRLRPVCTRRLSGKCTRLPAEANQLLRFYGSNKQGCRMV